MRPAILTPIFAPVDSLDGVGPTLARALTRLLGHNLSGLPVLRDLLFHLPVQRVDRRNSPPIHAAQPGQICTFCVTVEEHQAPSSTRYGNSSRPYKIICTNPTGTLTVVLFNARADQVKKQFPIMRECVVSGRVERYEYSLQMLHPDIVAPISQLPQILRVEPVYPLTDGITQRRISQWVNKAILKLPDLPEWLPDALLKQRGWTSFASSLQSAHAPQEDADLLPNAPARERLAFDALLALQISYARARENTRAQRGRMMTASVRYVPALLASLPYDLTAGQTKVCEEITQDISSGKRMVRLLQGDVGSGKTIVALIAMLHVAESGAQAALMAPTELIAAQHATTLRTLLAPLGIAPLLLTGSVQGKERVAATSAIERGEAKIIVGTHALFQQHVEFADLALMVVDEQHRFGVEQRMALAAKGNAPHILHLSATPIPRSMTLVLYGDMESSILAEKPPGRTPVTTTLAPAARRAELVERLKQALDRGEKAYWICPAIDGDPDENVDVAAAEHCYREFQGIFGASTVGLVHGRMRPQTRDAAMEAFRAGAAPLLVATTVVEVGVDVSDATIMVIEQAERFGLSQLHQLRGRVGRGPRASYCVLLMSATAGDEARERLRLLTQTEDGFAIAEADLRYRGGGEVLGRRQSGLQALRGANIALYAHLLPEAKALADTLVEHKEAEIIETLTALFL